jgi:Xaa-Pro dipeptidase
VTLSGRLARVQEGLRERGADVLVSFKPQNTFYLSGFSPVLYSHPVIVVLPATGEPTLVVHALRGHSSRSTSPLTDIRTYGRWSTEVGAADWLSAVVGVLNEGGLATGAVGVESDFLPMATAEALRAALPGARLVDAGDAVMRARHVKDAGELRAIRAASRISDVGMDAAIAAVAERASEIEVSVAAMTAMQREWQRNFADFLAIDFGSTEGGVINALWSYCLVGDRVPLNSMPPTTRRPADGEIVWVVIWTACDGIHAENERSVAVGELDAQRRRAFEALLAVRAEAQQAIRPGATCADVYRAAEKSYVDHGYGDYLPGRVGHGLGLGPHEAPSLGPADDLVLASGMTLTFEPNLRIPSFGGLQHSDSLVVTDDGFEFLTTTRRDLIQV